MTFAEFLERQQKDIRVMSGKTAHTSTIKMRRIFIKKVFNQLTMPLPISRGGAFC
jgi:hypothetical protein